MNYADLFRVTLPETVLEVAALVILVVDLGLLRKATLRVRAASAALLGTAGCMAALWFVLQGPGAGFRYGDELLLSAGGATAVAQIAILALTGLTVLLLVDSGFTQHVGEFVAVVLMSATGGLVISAAQDLLVIFTGLELLSLGLYILTAFAKTSGRSAEGALKYYLFGGMSAAFLLFGFSYLYGITGTTNLQGIMQSIHYGTSASQSPLLLVCLVMVAAGLGFKVAAVPFHLWAPDAYEGAPAPGAAFIASVSKVASFALLIAIGTAGARAVAAVPGAGFTLAPWGLILVVLSVASMAWGNLAALAQISVRRLLAYSAVAHAGYMLLALAYMSPASVARLADSILYYIVTYGLTTIAAFGAVGVLERATGSDRLDAFLGLHRRSPLLAAVLMVLFLSLAGIPPLVGFWAKFNLFAAVLGAGAGIVPFTLVALAVAMSAVSLYYYLQVLKRAYVMPPVDETPIALPTVTLLVMVAVAAAVVVFGCFPGLLQGWISSFGQLS